jgi:hypothetical protein
LADGIKAVLSRSGQGISGKKLQEEGAGTSTLSSWPDFWETAEKRLDNYDVLAVTGLLTIL